MKDGDTFGREWVEAWNRRDVEAVLAHYRDDVRFVSPTAALVTGNPVVEGKDALRAYWTAALKRIGELRFAFDRVLWDPAASELLIVYTRELEGRRERACELFRFDASELVFEGEALYGARLNG